MDVPGEVLRTHRDLSGPAERLLQLVREAPEVILGSDYREDPTLAECIQGYAYPFQTWPILVGERKLRTIERVTVEIVQLIKAIPRRILGNDPKRLAEMFGLQSPLAAMVLLEPPQGLDEALARCDLIDTGEALKVVEVNVGANIGGWQHRYWQRICRNNPNLRKVFTGVELDYRDPIRMLFEHVVSHRLGIDADQEEINTFIGFDHRDLPVVEADGDALTELYAQVLSAAGCGGRLRFGTFDELRVGAKLIVENRGGIRIHALVDCCTDDIPLQIVRCFKGGTIDLFNGPLARVLSTKKSLALLSMWSESEELDEKERQLIRDHVPWSRPVAPGRVSWRGVSSEIRDVLREERESLVLKPQRGARGEGVEVGKFTAPEEWDHLVDQALADGSWLAQEYAASRPYLMQQGERGVAEFDAVWGTFCFGERYAGSFVRAEPRDSPRGGVINSARGAEQGIVFEVKE